MGVYIKGMEMYERCSDPDGHWACPLFGSVYPHGFFCKAKKREIEDPFSRQPWCPLVEIPPHGRLIDADKEATRVRKLYDRAVEKDPDMGCVIVYEGEIALLQLTPTIIPADPAEEDAEE